MARAFTDQRVQRDRDFNLARAINTHGRDLSHPGTNRFDRFPNVPPYCAQRNPGWPFHPESKHRMLGQA